MLLAQLERTEYTVALDLQRRIVEGKLLRGGPDVLLILEHPHTITLGTRGNPSDVLVPQECLHARGIAVHSVDRGGEATYHGPGQIVCYPIVDLKSMKISVRSYVTALESAVLRTLEYFGVEGFRKDGKVGVWTGEHEKIASIGIRIRRRITYHGFSLNVNLELDPAELIVSCGMPLARMVDLRKVTRKPVDIQAVRHAIADSFSEVFDVDLETCSVEDIMEGF
jgi:lipoyl(octanoyl) transferase